jgi:outer membrane lipoprotein-sorting protein
MTCLRTGAIFLLTIALAAIVNASPQANNTLPSTEDVVAKMLQQDEQRQADFAGYTATRHYVATNKNRHAEMVARVDCSGDGVEQFQIVSENGSGTIRQYVFHKLLNEEADASRQERRDRTRITPQNYTFQIVRQDVLDTGPAYVLTVHPKSENKFLMRGTIWVDARDYSIVRIDGQPARSPSFWLHSVHFVRTYRKVAQMWLTSSIHSTEEIRLFGPAELWIETSDYVLKSPTNHLAQTGRTPPTSQ